MYSFYETIKKQVDLQDLVEYLNDPLEKLKLLQIKLQEYKNQNLQDNKIEIEELIRETDKLEKTLFPDLINNYCKLSLEFRNNSVIKQTKDKEGNTINYTSKDLLLKNVAKLIEHIDILDEKFYTYFSFEFLVNSRIISDLGYQENFIDNNEKSPVVLKNQYVFSKLDAQKIIDEQLSDTKIKSNPIYTRKLKEELLNSSGPKLQLKKEEEDSEIENIFNKKELDDKEDVVALAMSGISFLEIQLVIGFIIMAMLGVFIIYGKVKANQERQMAAQQQKESIEQIEDNSKQIANNSVIVNNNTNQILQQLNANKEKNNNIAYQEGIDNAYKQAVKMLNNTQEWKNLNNANKELLPTMNTIRNNHDNNQNASVSGNETYKVNVENDKVKIEIGNVFKSECQYMGVKLAGEYKVKINNQELTADNAKELCSLTNTVAILEK